MSTDDVTVVAVDGTDALACVMIRPAPDSPTKLALEAWAKGISKRDAAFYLRQVADLWDPAGKDPWL